MNALPRKLKTRFVNHDCQTVPDAALSGKKNGELLAVAERLGFEIFLTAAKASNTSRIWHAATSLSSLFFAPGRIALRISFR
jgi:hypothetical protein